MLEKQNPDELDVQRQSSLHDARLRKRSVRGLKNAARKLSSAARLFLAAVMMRR